MPAPDDVLALSWPVLLERMDAVAEADAGAAQLLKTLVEFEQLAGALDSVVMRLAARKYLTDNDGSRSPRITHNERGA